MNQAKSCRKEKDQIAQIWQMVVFNHMESQQYENQQEQDA